jgi:hypothetical protein
MRLLLLLLLLRQGRLVIADTPYLPAAQSLTALHLSLSLLPRHGDKKQGLKRWLEEQ